MTTKIKFHTRVLNSAYVSYLKDTRPLQIFYGGSSSGKSVYLAERAAYDLLSGGRNYLVCRQVGRTLRGSVVQEIAKVIKRWGVDHLFSINKTDGTITNLSNGYQIIFSGLDDVEKLKSITPAKGVITDIWVEEATEIERESLKQLEKRLRGGSDDTPKRITLSFNPILKTHWIYQEYFSAVGWADNQTVYTSDSLLILKTTYKDNRFLTRQDVDRLENETDEYYRQVYTLGNWGVLGDVIFKNISIRDLSEQVPQFTNRRAGLDFGFASDPAALPVMHYDTSHKRLYIFREFYERGLTNQQLAVEIKKLIGNDPLTCDSAEPKSIQELQAEGIAAHPAAKGKDSVNFGIQWLQGCEIIIDKTCTNAQREFSTYHWRKDKDGNSLRQPVDKDNHLIDAARYALETDMLEGSSGSMEDWR